MLEWFYMPIPVDKDGKGPVGYEEAYKIIHEVWDMNNVTICECPSQAHALLIVKMRYLYLQEDTKDQVVPDKEQLTLFERRNHVY